MRRFRMTRTIACLLSLFMPLIVVVPAVTLLVSLPGISSEILSLAILVVAAGVIALRVHFASWYVNDKGRNRAWGFLGAIGIIGWLFLWSLDDRGFRFVR